MMNQTTIRLEPKLKKDFANVCDDMGLSVSAAITIFAKTVVRERRIPFEVASNPIYAHADELLREAAEIDEAIANGTAKVYNSLEELFASWREEDSE
ncbi:MAG: type II toxin-antitoxin system RelB/DinJ family antitoxin [Oscillospiraceae bacterium]|nr:type II toxin-antitoxin system RelB/DinJ family antitoxin [Oscillospiraceae bacterium]